MAPNFPRNTQTRRGNRSGYAEHEDFESLPIRQWRQDWVTIAPPPPPDPTRKNDIWSTELPYGMPKDTQLLPSYTQDLLRAARSGRCYKRPAPAEEDEAEPDPTIAEKAEKKDEDTSIKGFQTRVWKQVARNAEGSTVSYLAKRRKGTITLSSDLPAGTAAAGPTITRATVRRVDAAGNPYTQEVVLNEGQLVDGEIISTTVVAAPVPTANVEASATPVRRRPPPPKRKPKGPGRGRRKKLMPLPMSASNPNAVKTAITGPAPGVQADGAPGLKTEDNDAKQKDTEMADDDDNDDGDDGEDDGEEGDEDDEDEAEGADGDTGFASRADSESKSEQMDITPSQNETEESAEIIQSQPSQDLLPASNNLSAPPLPLPHVEGSPLKHVVAVQSPGGPEPEPEPVSLESAAEPLATQDTIEQTLQPVESVPEPLPAMDESALAEIPGIDTIPTIDRDATEDVDVEMQDASPPSIDGATENLPLASLENPTTTAIADVLDSSVTQPIESSGLNPTVLPVEEVTPEQTTLIEPPSNSVEGGEATMSATGEAQTLETSMDAGLSAEPLANDTLVRDTLAHDAPAQDIPAEDTPAQDTPARDTPARDAPARDAPAQDSPDYEPPAPDVPAHDTPVLDAPALDVPTSETAMTLIETPTVQITEGSPTHMPPVSAPVLAEPQDVQPTSQPQERNEADSPDLFSGLEAALNQHGPSTSSEPPPDKPEAAVSQPDPVIQSD
ncbi:hypothetical protein F4808DRAFT_457307 [Astrocystis sublimbata]|nr:hypothetical protein F4808DRAFT_457307 [Astrocystis sublimbata]